MENKHLLKAVKYFCYYENIISGDLYNNVVECSSLSKKKW